MSAATVAQPVRRQPFGSLSQARLRNLSNTKNTQNALYATGASNLKQHATSESHEFDAENIDPGLLLSPSKYKGFSLDARGPTRAACFTLKTSKISGLHEVHQASVSRKRKAEDPLPGPDSTIKRRVELPAVPLVPAGRSPPRKHAGLLSRRRACVPFTRIDPPTSSSRVPFSLSAALAGTVPLKSKKRSFKKAWDFQIYEDLPQDEMANLMEHSTCILDISDDESRSSPKADRDDKENVPPSDYFNTSNSSPYRRDKMNEDIRTPLGDLDAKDFFAEGCDATSAFVVPADDEEPDEKAAATVVDSPTPANNPHISSGRAGWEDLLADLSAKKHNIVLPSKLKASGGASEPPEEQIWESESAKAEEEEKQGAVTTAGAQT